MNSAAENYSYPWRDNFCEHRFFFVGQCPGGLGHQGQDIRPASCKQRVEGANRCEPYQHNVVAVRDGAVLRAPNQEALYIVVNAPNERLRFRYLHMQPKQLDADGMVNGRLVREGEVIGKVGNFFKRERATTYHLHFDVQVPTKYGWVFVNPYMTLVASYERLIRGRGQEISDDVPTAAMPATPRLRPAAAAAILVAKPTETVVESPPSEGTDTGMARHDRVDQPSPVAASVPAAAGGAHREHAGAGARHESSIRPMGREFPCPRPRARHIGRHLHARDGQHQARHVGLRARSRAARIQRGALAIPQSPRLRLAHHDGKEKAKEYAPLLARIEKDYGVERSVMLGLWGIESAYGDPVVQKNHMRPVIPALAALAWGEPRRRAYWEQELLNALGHHRARLEHARGDARLLGRRHGPHPMDAGGVAQCRRRLRRRRPRLAVRQARRRARRHRALSRQARQVPRAASIGATRCAACPGRRRRRVAQLRQLAEGRRDPRRRQAVSAAERHRQALGAGAGRAGLPARTEFLCRALATIRR